MVQKHKRDFIFVTFSYLHNDVTFDQEFKEGRRNYQQAPQVLFSHKDPPAELQGTNARTGDNIGYITFGRYQRSHWWQHCIHHIR